eukprot:4576006-Alexandrium_andersonii.AAC.1
MRGLLTEVTRTAWGSPESIGTSTRPSRRTQGGMAPGPHPGGHRAAPRTADGPVAANRPTA